MPCAPTWETRCFCALIRHRCSGYAYLPLTLQDARTPRTILFSLQITFSPDRPGTIGTTLCDLTSCLSIALPTPLSLQNPFSGFSGLQSLVYSFFNRYLGLSHDFRYFADQ